MAHRRPSHEAASDSSSRQLDSAGHARAVLPTVPDLPVAPDSSLAHVAAPEEALASAIRTERARLAREIHDGLAQHLAFLKLRVSWLRTSSLPVETEALAELEEVLELALSDARAAITALRFEPEREGDVGDAIATCAADFGQRTGLGIAVVQDSKLPEMGAIARLELARVVQESLNNVWRHAGATRVDVEIRARSGLEITVKDDGNGFDVECPTPGRFGLSIMRERVESVGGRISVTSSPGEGTRVRILVPEART